MSWQIPYLTFSRMQKCSRIMGSGLALQKYPYTGDQRSSITDSEHFGQLPSWFHQRKTLETMHILPTRVRIKSSSPIDHLSNYVVCCKPTSKGSPSWLNSQLYVCISFQHKILGLDDPTQSFIYSKFNIGLSVLRKTSRSKRQAHPVTLPILKTLLKQTQKQVNNKYHATLLCAIFSLKYYSRFITEVSRDESTPRSTHTHRQQSLRQWPALWVVSSTAYKYP